jgi:hypothetical protein
LFIEEKLGVELVLRRELLLELGNLRFVLRESMGIPILTAWCRRWLPAQH